MPLPCILPSAFLVDDTTMNNAQFKHYQIKHALGEGGFGQVFEAWDSKLCRSVALKRLKNLGGSLLHEARMGAQLEHAAFVKVHAVEDDEDSQTIVMELVRGQTLKQMLQAGPLPAEQSLDIVQQIAQAMQEAHAKGLIHGDLKPSNLIVDPNGKVRILDFGLASQADPEVTTSLMQADPQGTISYMAPERLMGAASSVQSDVYALGVILYELLNGKRPFAELSGLALAAAHMQSSCEQWPFATSLSLGLRNLILSMTAKEPAQRLSSMAEVLECIARFVASTTFSKIATTNSAPQSEQAALQAQSRLKRPVFRMAALLLVVSLLGMGIWRAIPWVPVWLAAAKPFSESLAMKNGMEALKRYDRRGGLDDAVKNFSEVLERNPQNAAAIAAISLAHSLRYLSDGRDEVWLQKADAGAQQAMQMNNQIALSHIAKGWVLRCQGKFSQTLPFYDQALALDPSNTFALIGKMVALRNLRRYDEARKEVQVAMQRFPNERMFVDESGMQFHAQGNFSAAEQAFRTSIKMQPDATNAYANLNASLLQQSRYEEGLQVLQQGLQIQPNATLYTSMGNAYIFLGDYMAAAQAFESAVSPTKGNPADYLGWANLGDAYSWLPGKTNEASKAYMKAHELLAQRIAKSKEDFVLYSRMGLYAARLARKDESERNIKKAISMAPNDANVHYRAGVAQELLGNRSGALAEIKKAKLLGYPPNFIKGDPDLVQLRRDPAFE